MTFNLPNQEPNDLEAIKTLRKRLIFTRVLFSSLLILVCLAIMTHQIPFSAELLVGIIFAVIAFELGLLRYDYMGALLKIFNKN